MKVRFFALVLLAGASARATGEAGRAVQDPLSRVSRLGLEQDLSGFDVHGVRGTRYTLTARYDWAATPAFSLRVRAPVHFIWLRGSAGKLSGIGDWELRAKARIVDIDGYILVQAGVIETMPTGDPRSGLGNGAMQLTPFVTGGYKIGDTILYAYLSDAVALRPDSAPRYDDLADPSADHETQNAIGVITGTPAFQVNASLSTATALTKSELGHTSLSGSAVAGFGTDTVRFLVGGALPIAGAKRFDWRALLDAYVFF
jgi:hypothetical protein